MEGSAYEFFSPMGSRGMLRGPKEVQWGPMGCLGDPMGPSGWFDECPDDP